MSLLQAAVLTRMRQTIEDVGGDPDAYRDAISAISGLVSWWRWGEAAGAETAVDEEGVQNGAYLGGVALNHGPLMLNTDDTSMRLNGTTAFVDIADNAAFHLANGTLAIWFNSDSLASDRYLISKNAAGIVQGDLEVYYRVADNTFRYGIEDGTTVQRATVSGGAPLPTGVLSVGTTYCAVIQWGSGGMKFYLASGGALTLIGTNAYTGGLATNTNPWRIGASQWSGAPSQFFDGGLDDAILWNRQLSVAELNVVIQMQPAQAGLIDFVNNNSTLYYQIPSSAALNFPAGVGAWAFWTRVDENTGSLYQYALSCGGSGAVPVLQVYLVEASEAVNPNKFAFIITDNAGGGGGTQRISTVATGADGVERLVVAQSTGTAVEMWLCPRGGAATRVYNAAVALGALTPALSWNLGRRADGETSRYWEEWLGGLFKSNIALSQAQIEQIAGPQSPVSVLGSNCAAFWPFNDGAVASELDVVGGIVATKQTTAGEGIAALYPGDVGISGHPSVLFHADFEAGTLGGMSAFNSSGSTTLPTNIAANVHSGTWAVEATLPGPQGDGGDVGGDLNYFPSPGRELLFMRWYVKYDPAWNIGVNHQNHAGGSIRYNTSDETLMATAAFEPNISNAPPWTANDHPPPGELQHYTYHRDRPGGLTGFGQYLRPNIGPSGELAVGQWFCVENMVKLNTIGQTNGEIKGWINGVLVTHYTGLNFRISSSIVLNQCRLGAYIHFNTVRTNKIWWDDVVVATEYIGPMRS